MLMTMDSALQVAEEEVVESCSSSSSSPSKFEDIHRLLSEGCFPPAFCSIKRKNLKRYAQKFIVEGNSRIKQPKSPGALHRSCTLHKCRRSQAES